MGVREVPRVFALFSWTSGWMGHRDVEMSLLYGLKLLLLLSTGSSRKELGLLSPTGRLMATSTVLVPRRTNYTPNTPGRKANVHTEMCLYLRTTPQYSSAWPARPAWF